jgi:hypothetical protein
MRRRRILALAALIAATLAGSGAARAQTAAPSVTYSPGWTMIGGPPGTDFSALAPLYAWASSGYYNPSSNTAVLCQGYWSLVALQTTVTLAASVPGATQDCALRQGWNLVGNPFTLPALLPAGLIAYAINKTTGNYMQVPAIEPGGAVWIYTSEASTITLRQAPTPRTPIILTISTVPSGPYTVHVGDVIQLFMPSTPVYTATTDSRLLPLDQSGLVMTLDCIGEPSCAFTTTQRFWTWHAADTGTASINVVPGCAGGGTACGVTGSIQIDIEQ